MQIPHSPTPPPPPRLIASPLVAPLPSLRAQYNNAHRSDAEALVAEVPVVLVQGKVALCDGGGGALGHPVEYIQLAKAFNQDPVDCPYCGLRYQMDPSWNSHGHH